MSSHYVVIGLIVVLMLYLALRDWVHPSANRRSIIVSLGVLGTFYGISYGVYHFDVTQLDSSIVDLINGLKIAFFTSTFGLMLYVLLGMFNRKDERSAVTSKLLDNQERMIESLENALNKVSQSAHTEILSALEKIVNDFNKGLERQFGNNFTNLKVSVDNLNEWQKSYKSTIEHLGSDLLNVSEQLTHASHQLNAQVSGQAATLNKIDRLSGSTSEHLMAIQQTVTDSLNLIVRDINGYTR
ncbi:MAG: hypothetical protein JHC38_08010 [Thiotrichales bacterium]|jgi:archaellum component FlaC|nr:hypothetical protein [Thiotrichales bacterium]